MKVLHCRDVGFDCDEEIRGQSEEEVMERAVEHAQTKHSFQVTPDFAAQLKPHIIDEETLKKIPPTLELG